MRAMILAAGYGKRMNPITLNIPKPLIEIKRKSLISYHIEALSKAGFKEIIINISYLGDLIKQTLQDGNKYNVTIKYSEEETPLETAGGIKKALPLLGEDPFLIVNADIFTDYNFANLKTLKVNSAHIVLVDNPLEHLQGDFSLNKQHVTYPQEKTFTYAGIGIFHPQIFANTAQYERLAVIFNKLISDKQLTGSYYAGKWTDVGTPQKLAQLENEVS